jgi:hypothetical protein
LFDFTLKRPRCIPIRFRSVETAHGIGPFVLIGYLFWASFFRHQAAKGSRSVRLIDIIWLSRALKGVTLTQYMAEASNTTLSASPAPETL